MNVKLLLKDVVKEITPKSPIIPEANKFLDQLNQALKSAGVKATAVFGGSYAKNTWLEGDYDVDIFVKFSLALAHESLSNILESVLKPWKPIRVHGSRDYFLIKNTFYFEIVPVLDIKKPADAHNVTDFSPLHVRWVNKKGRKFKDDIRLTKKFMKAQSLYGAESYIRGFSGHVVDILTIYYKGFLNLLKQATKWKPKTTIDPNKVYKTKQAELILNKSKIEGPLIVVDPLQPDRNAAAAISQEKYGQFISAAKKFLKKPSKDFFIEKKISAKELKKQKNILVLQAIPVEGKEDPVGTKLLKAFEFFEKNLTDFKILDSNWHWDKEKNAVFWYKLKKKKLSAEKILQGPPLNLPEHVKKFKASHKKVFEKNKRLYALIKRAQCTPLEVFKHCKNDKYLKGKFKLIKNYNGS
ncbi:nucleotidyltransferase domain-containing protein [Candidatus Woesearchaeota archaeon]|nr:nucleotidyltransferase domain-containing protein [Candidatus Woesearchaeota archaeon]